MAVCHVLDCVCLNSVFIQLFQFSGIKKPGSLSPSRVLFRLGVYITPITGVCYVSNSDPYQSFETRLGFATDEGVRKVATAFLSLFTNCI